MMGTYDYLISPPSLSLSLSLCVCSVFEDSVSQRSVQDAGQRWRLRLGGESQCRHTQRPALQVQARRSPATLHPLRYLCPQVCVCVCVCHLINIDLQRIFIYFIIFSFVL